MRWLLAFALLAACGDPPDPSQPTDAGDAADASADAGFPDQGVVDSGAPPLKGYLNRLETSADYATLTSSVGGGIKYLARIEGRPPFLPLNEPCYFQDMNLYSWHLNFLRSFPEHAALAYDSYLSMVLRRPTRVFWGGAVQLWSNVAHPDTQRPGVMAFVTYAEPNGLSVNDIIAAKARLAGCMPFAQDLLVFVPEGPDQRILVNRERAELAAQGVFCLFPEDLLRGISHQPYSRGEGYGTLRVVPRGQSLDTYGPREVVVVEGAPNDISVVAGLISAFPQNPLGHVNLRLQEKGIPNVAVPSIYDAAWLSALENQLVHLVVTDEKFEVTPARLEDAEKFWAAHRPQVPPPQADLSVTTPETFLTLRHPGRLAYGVKAANLGELRGLLPPPASNDGFALPMAWYQSYAASVGLPALIEAALNDPRMRTDALYKKAQLKAWRDLLRDNVFPADYLAAVEAQALTVFGPDARTLKLRFRSSTNVEDLATLTGAGLYDSKSGCLADDFDGDNLGPSLCLTATTRADLERQLAQRQAELAAYPERTWLADMISDIQGDLTNEKPVSAAVQKVWASLWTERAFDEREYYGIDHRLAFMGIAVNPSFQAEIASGVVVTHLRPDPGLPLYRVNSQAGEISVVRPEDPTAIAELFTFRRDGDALSDLRYQSYSSLLPDQTPIWPDPGALASLVFIVHDHFARQVYPELSELRLDLEVKLTAAGAIVVKQARPYVSQDPSGQ